MKKIFLDANVLIDLISNRNVEKTGIDKIGEIGYKNIFCSSLSVHILFYICKIKFDSIEDKRAKNILKFFNIISLSDEIIKKSFKFPYSDYEDTLQYLCALDEKCSYILTRNKKDFEKIKKVIPSEIEIITNISQINQ
ncbi:MAG TPA: PIN domain-containing protein [Candidatus Dojkabacteria bacterium]|nr:PIN domain-containing protein [Candidatus Dojkabacteria bacterium]